MTEKNSEGTDGFYNAFSLFVLEDPEEDGETHLKEFMDGQDIIIHISGLIMKKNLWSIYDKG